MTFVGKVLKLATLFDFIITSNKLLAPSNESRGCDITYLYVRMRQVLLLSMSLMFCA